MTDIVDRLRNGRWVGGEVVALQAADEIDRLKVECAKQRRLKEGYYNEAVDGWAAVTEKDKEIEQLRAEIERKDSLANQAVPLLTAEIERLKAELDDWKKKALTKWMDSHD